MLADRNHRSHLAARRTHAHRNCKLAHSAWLIADLVTARAHWHLLTGGCTCATLVVRRGPGSASGNGTPWAQAASGWLVGWNRLYFVNFGYPFNRRYTRAPRICMAAQQHDHFRAWSRPGLQTHVTSAVLMIASSKQTQPYGSLLPENNTPVSQTGRTCPVNKPRPAKESFFYFG